MQTWFEKLVGFEEQSAAQVHRLLHLDSHTLHSSVNNRRFRYGRLETPSLSHLRLQTSTTTTTTPLLSPRADPVARIKVSEVVADVQALHQHPDSNRALFQVASQFNLLEMAHPSITPEHGVTSYARDLTQGPACAIACGAATIFRNYFVRVGESIGQTAERQLDCVRQFGDYLGNSDASVWTMCNGYALGHAQGVRRAGESIARMSEEERDELRGRLRIGVQYDAEVTIGDGGHNVVTQAFCSAFPVAYSDVSKADWEPLARILLEACYEATLRAAVVNAANGGSNVVFLTLVGGGVFGNDMEWIVHAIDRAVRIMESDALDVRIVSYRRPMAEIWRLTRD